MKPVLPLDRRIRDSVTDEVVRGLRRFLRDTLDFLGRHIGAGGTDQHPVFTSSVAGFVPAPGTSPSTHVLQADGTWAAGGGGGGVPTSRLINTTAPLTGGGDLTADRTLGVSTFAAGASGVVPASGGGTTNYLRADGTWTAPPSLTDGDKGDITVTGGGSTWTIDNGVVTLAKMATMSNNRLLGNATGAPASPVEVPIGSGLQFTGGSLLVAGSLDANARVTVRKNTGADVGARRRLNLIEGTNITLTVSDDAGNEEVDVTIAASGGGGGGLTVPQTLALASLRP